MCHGPPGKRAFCLPSYYLNVVSAVAYYCQFTTTTGAEAGVAGRWWSLESCWAAQSPKSLIRRSRCLRFEPDERSVQPVVLIVLMSSVQRRLSTSIINCGEPSPRARSAVASRVQFDTTAAKP